MFLLYFCLLRLIVFPLAVYAALYWLPLDRLLVSVSVLMTAMPAGSVTSILAEEYDCGDVFASELVFASTLFSVMTLPLLCAIL